MESPGRALRRASQLQDFSVFSFTSTHECTSIHLSKVFGIYSMRRNNLLLLPISCYLSTAYPLAALPTLMYVIYGKLFSTRSKDVIRLYNAHL